MGKLRERCRIWSEEECEFFKSNFKYDPDLGVVFRKTKYSNEEWIKIGTPHINGSLWYVTNKKTYSVARIAWFLHYGTQAPKAIRHKDGVSSNLTIDNLEIIPEFPEKSPYKRPFSKGVHWSRVAHRWIATVCYGNVRKYIGAFKEPEEALAARNAFIERKTK